METTHEIRIISEKAGGGTQTGLVRGDAEGEAEEGEEGTFCSKFSGPGYSKFRNVNQVPRKC